MATDRSLASLLRALQDISNEQDLSRLLGSAANLLTLLSNPLNVTLLSAHLLSAPAIWNKPEGLRTIVQVIGIFSSATIQILQPQPPSPEANVFSSLSRLSKEDWINAVVNGADERSPRWRHPIVLGGLLLGQKGKGKQTISDALWRALEDAAVKALNLALEELEPDSELAINSTIFMLSQLLKNLSSYAKHKINYNVLLPYICWSAYFSSEGLYNGYFLSTMDSDIIEGSDAKFNWSTRSSSYIQMQRIASNPLVASLGSFSQLAAHSVECVRDVHLLATMVGSMSVFTRSLCIQWRQNKLSEIDVQEETAFLSNESLQVSLPLMWGLLKNSMFSIVIILTSLLSRTLRDAKVLHNSAPSITTQILRVLRDLYFISSRSGTNAFSQYSFVYLTAIDILSQYPTQAENFLQEIKPAEAGVIAQHPLDRCHDLYFLNTAEHFAIVFTAEVNERLLLNVATAYLGVNGDQRLLEIFESAHSVILSVFLAPQNFNLVAKHIQFYVNALFQVYPNNLSPQQFRLATKTLVRISSPPFLLSASQPMLSSTLLELVRVRADEASIKSPPPCTATGNKESDISDQAVMVLTLIDSLPFLHLTILDEWLSITAESLNLIMDEGMRNICQQRFWEVLSSGEMDVDHAAQCVTWWSTKGGRDMVFRSMETVKDYGLKESSKL